MYTEDEWSQYVDMYEELENLADRYLREFGYKNESITGISVDDGSITINTEEYWNYGGHDSDSHSIPLRYLWTENWMEDLKADRERERIAKEKAEHQKLIDDNNKKLANEKAKYLELHQKYGGTNDSNN